MQVVNYEDGSRKETTVTTTFDSEGNVLDVTSVVVYFDPEGNVTDVPQGDDAPEDDGEGEGEEVDENEEEADVAEQSAVGTEAGSNDVKINITFDVTIDNTGDEPVISMVQAE